MSRPTDMRVTGAGLKLLPATLRMPLKLSTDTIRQVVCARVTVEVAGAEGRTATGVGETPLSVVWAWPGSAQYQGRQEAMIELCRLLCEALPAFDAGGHPMEISSDFQSHALPRVVAEINSRYGQAVGPMSHLAWLVCFSAFDIAMHDAFGRLHGVPTYQTYTGDWLSRDLAAFFDGDERFAGRFPADFLADRPATRLAAWHLVGGADPLTQRDCTGSEPNDAYPVTLTQWLKRDGLRCVKIKLRGNDFDADMQRMIDVGRVCLDAGSSPGVSWLSPDFNCAVTDPRYVTDMLDKLRDEQPRLYGMILYVEQPFAYELEDHPIDVRSVSARKPLFMDESAHDWRLIRRGQELGWTGVALKTCKTQTGALLSLCWAKANGMTLMVQDLTNPMLAIVPHALLAAHAGTIMGVEVNACQFYPEASKPEAAVHPGLYRRRNGAIDLATIHGPGFGYRLDEIRREV